MAENWHKKCVFGMHFDLHASPLDTELGKRITYETLRKTVETIKPQWLQCDCKGHPGLCAWPTKMGNEAPVYYADALKIHSDVAHDLNIPIGVHYSGCWDNDALYKHPDWAAIGPDGKPYEGQDIYYVPTPVCPQSPYWDELMIPQMLEIIEKYDVDGFWVDGDTWAVKPCYCPKCKAKFKEKTGHDAPIFRQVKSQHQAQVVKFDYSENYDVSYERWKEWCDFHREMFNENVAKYIQAVREKKPSCLVACNWMYGFMIPLPEKIDVGFISGDEPNTIRSAMCDGHFSLHRKADWDIMAWSMRNDGKYPNFEIKSETQLIQDYAYITACGGAAYACFQPTRGGLVADFVSEMFGRVGEYIKPKAVWSRRGKAVPEVAVIHNEADCYRNYGDTLIGPDANNPQFQKFYGLTKLLSGLHIQYDILTTYMIENLSDYKCVIITDQDMFDEEFEKKLEEYVKNGGCVILEGLKAVRRFASLAGIKCRGEVLVDEKTSAYWQWHLNLDLGEEGVVFAFPYEMVDLDGAESVKNILPYDVLSEKDRSDDKPLNPGITLNKFGKGLVYAINFNMFAQYESSMFRRIRELFGNLLTPIKDRFILQDVKAPHYVHFVVREQPDYYVAVVLNMGSVVQSDSNNAVCDEVPEIREVSFKFMGKALGKCVLIDNKTSEMSSAPCEGGVAVSLKDLEIMNTIIIYKQK